MAKTIEINKGLIEFPTISKDSETQNETFTITVTGNELVDISSIIFPTPFVGKLSTKSIFHSELNSLQVPRSFVEDEKYFMNVDGSLTGDESLTGIYVGTGQSDGTMLVQNMYCLQDENGEILQDELGNYLEDIFNG